MWWVQTLWDARKGPGQTLLISHFQLRLQISRFLQVTWQGCTSVAVLRRSQDLKMWESGWYSWYLKWVLSALTKHLQRLKNWQKQWFCSESCSAERHILVLRENLKWVLQSFSFPDSAVQRNTGVQDGRKCVGLPLPCYWMVVSTDMLFLQDPLGSCKGNESVIWGSNSFLEPCDSSYGHQRILVIISGQQFLFGHVMVQMSLNCALLCDNSTFSAKKNSFVKVKTWLT